MIEAWQIEHRPWLYFLLRRVELSRWSFRTKHWHPERRWYARIRALLLVWAGHETEVCAICGGKVGVVWWCADNVLWETVTGWRGGGVCCVQCFDDLAHKRGVPFLQWSCEPHQPQGYTNDEWRRIITANHKMISAISAEVE